MQNACIANVSVASACIANVSIASACVSNVSIKSACIVNISIASACISNVSVVSACITNASLWYVNITSGYVSVQNACISSLSVTNACITTLITNNVQNYGFGSLILQAFNQLDNVNSGMILCKQPINNMIFDQTTSSLSNYDFHINIRVSGFISPLNFGKYYFHCVSNGACRVYIDRTLIGEYVDPTTVCDQDFNLNNGIY